MSRIYFHSEHEGTAEVSGSERAHAHLLTSNLAETALGLAPGTPFMSENVLLEAVRPRLQRGQNLQTAIMFREDTIFEGPDKTPHRVSSVLCNTVLAIGSRPVRFLTRLHNQCEIHLWVEGFNRTWLAEIIEEGLNAGVCRKRMGWENVVTLLKRSSEGAVVTSYSVCEQFPNYDIAGWTPQEGEDSEAWYGLPEAEQWDMAMKGLREAGGSREITPSNLDNPRFFGSQVHGFELMDALMVAKAAPLEAARQARLAEAKAKGLPPSIMDKYPS